MIPKKAREFKEQVIKELNLSEDFVSKVIDFYWERVRKEMSGLENISIEVPNLGVFRIKASRIDGMIEKYKTVIINLDGEFKKYKLKKDLEERIEKLEKLNILAKVERAKFKQIIQERYDKRKNIMEEQNSNLGRSDEQDLQKRSSREDLQEKNENM